MKIFVPCGLVKTKAHLDYFLLYKTQLFVLQALCSSYFCFFKASFALQLFCDSQSNPNVFADLNFTERETEFPFCLLPISRCMFRLVHYLIYIDNAVTCYSYNGRITTFTTLTAQTNCGVLRIDSTIVTAASHVSRVSNKTHFREIAPKSFLACSI